MQTVTINDYLEGRVNEQQVYDFVIVKLREQGYASTRSSPGGDHCAYRGDGGRRCGIGWLIPDEQYHEDFEETSVTELVSIFPQFEETTAKKKEFLQYIQWMHDNSEYEGGRFRLSLEEDARKVCRKYSLVYTSVRDAK